MISKTAGRYPDTHARDAARSCDAVHVGAGVRRHGFALPMLHALQHDIAVDAFVVYTDSDTVPGKIHPVRALREYQSRTGIPAKFVVVGMASSGFCRSE